MRNDKLYTASTAGVAVALGVALVLMLNWLSYRHYVRGDWTSSKIYSLSEKTTNILKGIKSEVRAIVFMTPQTPMFGETKELLTRYQARCPLLKVEFIDTEREPLRTRELAQQFGVSAANTVVFAAESRKKYVTSDQLADFDYSGVQFGQAPKMKGFKGEEQFTAAILGVVDPKQPKIYFVTGHGEKDPDGMDPRTGFSQFKELLKRDNLEVQKTTLLSGAVPADCDLIVAAGPAAPFADNEKTALKAYLDKGGRALIMLDPVFPGRDRSSGLEDFVKAYGAQVGNDLVIDPARKLPFFDLSAVYVSEFRAHPVVDGMQGLAVILPVARSVSTVSAPGVASAMLLTTSSEGWGETDLEGIVARRPVNKDAKDTPGPVSLGVAAQQESDKEKGWRLVVLGNSAFATNGQVANVGNSNLAMNAVNWLAKRSQAIGIAPRQPEQVSLVLSAGQMRGVLLISLLGLPGLAVALGVGVWWRRRR